MKGSLVAVLFFACIWYGFFRLYHAQIQEVLTGSAVYLCEGGRAINVLFYDKKLSIYVSSNGTSLPGGRAQIALSDGRYFSLPRTVATSGARYANGDESFVFLTNGNRASVSEKSTRKDYNDCVRVAEQSGETNPSYAYVNNTRDFSLRLPSPSTSVQDGYIANDTHTYQLDSGKEISGVRFHIPASPTFGTNLSTETYISVESMPDLQECSAGAFFGNRGAVSFKLTENDIQYSVASMTDAGASNRHEERVYALPETSPCVGVRYFIQYATLESYKSGAVRAFDKAALLKEFDQIRHSLVVAQ
jgi:membrane-bound inhibitor of C-type lysozyme